MFTTWPINTCDKSVEGAAVVPTTAPIDTFDKSVDGASVVPTTTVGPFIRSTRVLIVH